MIKKQMRSLGHKAIVKKNQSHQEAFDEISQTKGVNRQLLADELSKIPSSGKQKDTASLRYIFIVCLAIIAGFRLLNIVLIFLSGSIDNRFLLIMVPIILLVPIFGIIAALFHKSEAYKTVGILLIITILQSLRRGELTIDLQTLLVLLPVGIAVFLAFYIPSKLKTSYKKTIAEKYVDGKLVKTTNYVFEDTRVDESNILDARF